jgi:acylphosphatase
LIARNFLIKGRVQGVGYRYFAVREARKRNLVGWTRNLPDGQVEVLVEGERDAVEEFKHLLSQGPRTSMVESVGNQTVEPTGSFTEFNVRTRG